MTRNHKTKNKSNKKTPNEISISIIKSAILLSIAFVSTLSIMTFNEVQKFDMLIYFSLMFLIVLSFFIE